MKRIIAHLPFCTGLPRFARNDDCAPRHCVGVSPWQSSLGFSLIELLVSLIIISLIISSFLPILTSKLKHQNTTLSSGIINCKKFGSECILCDKTSCTLCSTQINLLDGQYVDSKTSCEVKNCPSNCKRCNDKKCLACNDKHILIDDKCVESCIKIGNICVQKFNAGDPGGMEIPEGLVTVKSTVASGASGGGQHTQAICWKGKTAGSCDSANGGYSGCNRTLCTWYAADKICKFYGWRLPTHDELSLFLPYSKGKGDEGLQLCDEKANNSSAWCTDTSGCPGSYNGNCDASNIWTTRLIGTLRADCFSHSGGGLYGSFEVFAAYPFSVRCVKDL